MIESEQAIKELIKKYRELAHYHDDNEETHTSIYYQGKADALQEVLDGKNY